MYEFILIVIGLLGSGTAAGVILYFLNRKTTESVAQANVNKASAEIRKIEQEIEAQYIEQLQSWITDLKEIHEKHEVVLQSKEEEIGKLHKLHLDAIKELDESRIRLEKSGRATQRLMAKTNTPYWECDALGKIVYVNGAWLQLFGLQHDEALGNKWMETIEPSEAKASRLLWFSAITDLNDRPLIFTIINPVTKEVKKLEFIYSNIHDIDGSVLKVIGVVLNRESLRDTG